MAKDFQDLDLTNAFLFAAAMENPETCGLARARFFLNTKGKNPEQVPKELISFLKFVVDSTEECAEEVQDERIQRLNQKLKGLKKSRRLEEEYMTMQEMLEDQRNEGKAEGKAEGRAEGITVGRTEAIQEMGILCTWMVEHGLSADIPRLGSEPDFYQDMLEKCHQDRSDL